MDSLTKINVPVNQRIRTIDSLNQIKDKKLSTISGKVEEIKTNSIDKIRQLNLPPEFQEKLNEYTAVIDKLDVTLPTSQFKVPDLQLPIDLNLSMPDLNNVLEDGLSNLPELNIGGAEGISQNVSQLGELADGIPKDISSENLAQAAETNLAKISEIGEVKDQLGDMPAIPMSSEEEAGKELIKQAKEVAVDHFAGKEQEVKSAMDQISKYKKKFPNINNLEELAKQIKRKPTNEMKGKPFIERIVPGIVFQIQKKNDELFVDFNPYVGYRFTGKRCTSVGTVVVIAR